MDGTGSAAPTWGRLDRVDPLDKETRAALRRAVFALRSGERRRVFETAVHVGDPDGEHASYAVGGDRLDQALRVDLLATLLTNVPEDQTPAFWLTRVGVPEPHDDDRVWLAAARQAFAEAGQEPRWCAIVTKNGWYDPVGGDSVTWDRLRIRTRIRRR